MTFKHLWVLGVLDGSGKLPKQRAWGESLSHNPTTSTVNCTLSCKPPSKHWKSWSHCNVVNHHNPSEKQRTVQNVLSHDQHPSDRNFMKIRRKSWEVGDSFCSTCRLFQDKLCSFATCFSYWCCSCLRITYCYTLSLWRFTWLKPFYLTLPVPLFFVYHFLGINKVSSVLIVVHDLNFCSLLCWLLLCLSFLSVCLSLSCLIWPDTQFSAWKLTITHTLKHTCAGVKRFHKTWGTVHGCEESALKRCSSSKENI